MFWRRRLPHVSPEGLPVFLTWRLAGSIPASRPANSHNDPNPGKAFAEFDRVLDRTRLGPRWLADTNVANMFVEALNYGADVRQSYDLGARVVMPNHVHLVMLPHEPLPDIVGWLRKTTAYRAKRLLGIEGPFSQREYYDHWIRSRESPDRISAYIERNPVAAGLVASPEDWPWSSAQKKPATRSPALH